MANVGPNSPWINGMKWMRGEKCDFPVKTVREIVLSSESKSEAKKESIEINERINQETAHSVCAENSR